MNTNKDGGPAFPRDSWMDKQIGLLVQQNGMSLRDWFAGQALQVVHDPGGRYGPSGLEKVAEQAYAMADAMLAAREKGNK